MAKDGLKIVELDNEYSMKRWHAIERTLKLIALVTPFAQVSPGDWPYVFVLFDFWTTV